MRLPFIFKSLLLACLSGAVSGTAVSLFLESLHHVVEFKLHHEWLLFLLPLAGIILGRMTMIESNLVLEEVHSPKEVLPIRFGPQIWISTLLSHAFGASVGREGAATHIGASFADQIARIFRVTPEERRTLLVCGLAAGLGTAVGAPWAGVVFGFESFHLRHINLLRISECVLASLLAAFISHFLHTPEHLFPNELHLSMNFNLMIAAAGAGIIFGFLALCFEGLHGLIRNLYVRANIKLFWRPVIGGLVFIILILVFSLQAFESLSTEMIKDSFSTPSRLSTPILKLLLTAFALGSGFRGGEFTPLVVMGASAGSWMEGQLQTGTLLLPALGCSALFGTTARVPITAAVMTVEWFGLEIGLYAGVAAFTAYGMKVLFHRKMDSIQGSGVKKIN